MDDDDGELLAAMGLTDRCLLRVCRAGEPCIVQVAGSRLGLAAALARRILVVPVDVGA
jgi:Fe2+ transport system protein FeoA